MKKPNYFKLSTKKLSRSVKRSPLQFLAISLITALSSTLFLGLCASYKSFENRVNETYKAGNVADIWTTIDSNDKDGADLSGIKNVVSNEGNVEGRYYSQGKINEFANYFCLSDSYPTINKEYFTTNKEKEDFFIIDYRYVKNHNAYGAEDIWLDKNGNFKDVSVKISISSLYSEIKNDDKCKSYLDKVTKKDKTNVLNNELLPLTLKPTGYLISPENIISTSDTAPTTLASRSFMINVLTNTLKDNYDVSLAPTPTVGTTEYKIYEIINNPKEKLVDNYWSNNQFLTKLNDSGQTRNIQTKIDDYFLAKGDNNNLLLNTNLANTKSYAIVSNDISQSKVLAFTFPLIFVLVAIFVVLTTLSQIVVKDRHEIGTLKAVGVSKEKVTGYYLSMSMFVSIIGILIGGIVGPLLLPTLLNIKFRNLYYIPAMRFTFPTVPFIIFSITLFFLFMIVTNFAVRKEVNLMPAESMRPKVVKNSSLKKKNKKRVSLIRYINYQSNTKKTLIKDIKEGLVKVNGKVIFKPLYRVDIINDAVTYKDKVLAYHYKSNMISIKLALRNINKAIPRSLMVIIGVLGCTSLLAAGFCVDDSISYSINNDWNRFYSKVDLDVKISNSNPMGKIEELENKYYISTYENYAQLPTNLMLYSNPDKVYSTYVYAISPLSSYFDLPGGVPKGDKIYVSNKVANELNLKNGSQVVFSVFGKRYRGEISVILDNFFVHGIFVNYLAYSDFQNYAANVLMTVNTLEGKSRSESISYVSDILKNESGVTNVTIAEAYYNQCLNICNSLTTITLVIKIFAVLLAVVVLYNLILLNYKERERDIATMKVLGFSHFKLALSFIVEILLLTFIGSTLGLFFGLPLASFMLNINKTSVIEFLIYIAPLSYLYSFLITFGAAFIINILLSYKFKKVKMVESLKSVE